ncbi:hypothetical protein QQG55_40755 [Brugia pahangi]
MAVIHEVGIALCGCLYYVEIPELSQLMRKGHCLYTTALHPISRSLRSSYTLHIYPIAIHFFHQISTLYQVNKSFSTKDVRICSAYTECRSGRGATISHASSSYKTKVQCCTYRQHCFNWSVHYITNY